ncbi:MAG: hypothetical protein AAB883_00990 [Patescibacteria group bacterium]
MNEDTAELKKLLEETLAVAEDNNRLLKLIRRDATVSLVVKVLMYLLLVGVPIFFLSQFLHPLLTPGSGASPAGMFGIPSKEQIDAIKGAYGL